MVNHPFPVSSVAKPVERITVETNLAFEQLADAFERQLGRYDHVIGENLASRHADWEEASTTIDAMNGPHGLMIIFRLDLGATASLKGEPRQCLLYLIGNPLVATEIVSNDLRAALLVPFRVEIYAEGGKAMISYDRPSSSLGTLENAAINSIGAALDQKIAAVIAAIALAETTS